MTRALLKRSAPGASGWNGSRRQLLGGLGRGLTRREVRERRRIWVSSSLVGPADKRPTSLGFTTSATSGLVTWTTLVSRRASSVGWLSTLLPKPSTWRIIGSSPKWRTVGAHREPADSTSGRKSTYMSRASIEDAAVGGDRPSSLSRPNTVEGLTLPGCASSWTATPPRGRSPRASAPSPPSGSSFLVFLGILMPPLLEWKHG